MATVVADMSMSLDGFVAGPNDEVREVFSWMTAGVEQASEHAGDGIVGVAGASVVRQCLNAEILDAVRVSLVPYLIGEGTPYFAGLKRTPVKLGQPKVVAGKGVTHLYYEVL